jgi:predicted nucleic acid-binding protein
VKKRIQIYLDTSVINFLFADDSPENRDLTCELFDNYIKTGIYETYISDFVIAEIEETKNAAKKKKLLDVLNNYPIELVELNNKKEIEQLAKKYIAAGIIPAKKFVDALHIAVTVTKNIPYLVSWNYKHLANINKEQKIKIVNIQNGYINELRIITPLELSSDEN